MAQLLRRSLPFGEDDLTRMLKLANDNWDQMNWYRPHKSILGAIQRRFDHHELPAALVAQLKKVNRLTRGGFFEYAEDREVRKRAMLILGEIDPGAITPDFDWSKSLAKELAEISDSREAEWQALVEHAISATASRPSKKWLATAGQLVEAVGEEKFVALFNSTLPRIGAETHTELPLGDDNNSHLVKGLVWIASLVPPEQVAREIKLLAIYCFRKIPGIGAVSTRVGNACVYVLGQMPGLESVAALNELNQKIKYPSARKLVEKALNEAAARSGMSRLDLEEISVPDFGLDENGELRRELDGLTGIARLEGPGAVTLAWQNDSSGKLQKTVPKAIKETCAAEIRELRRVVKDIQSTLQAQMLRLESMYLQDRAWAGADWQQRFIDHPLLGGAVRRLIWLFDSGDHRCAGVWRDGRPVDVSGEALPVALSEASVRLWHPIYSGADEVLGWRRYLLDNEITQPFKQAHREVYILTDAERTTEQYSNRFAAHVLKQHQMNALCQQRGWRYSLQGAFDSWNEPTLELPTWNMHAEFWVEPIETEPGDSGIYPYVSSDQVRFVRDGELIRLADVEPLVFSEVMRHVDLFVGVCSIGNDPEWNDRGLEGYGQYWREYSFGDLNATARTRREILEFLLPKLKIADRCRIDDRYLVVRGNIRSYRIHLGSANILMEPDDQYLCIVEGRNSNVGRGKLFLPFEGDHRMAIILSKAFLLADDDKIKDRTILSQIRSRHQS